MIRKYTIIALVFILSFQAFGNMTFAYTLYQTTGNALIGEPSLIDNVYHQPFRTADAYKVVIGSYSDSTYTNVVSKKTYLRPDSGVGEIEEILFKCNRYYQATLFDEAGTQTALLQFQSTEIAEPTTCDSGIPYPVDTTGDGTGGNDGGGTGGSGEECIGCEIFNCPGWGDYMNGLEEIKNAIPPAPDWQVVANTFRDTIVPSVMTDLGNLLGSTPQPPSAPVAPVIPTIPSDLDNRGITAPTGQEAPGLGDSTFDSTDIKNEAEVIIERPDPTGGGFSILDPTVGLPTQDEFIQNQPNEGTAAIPPNPIEGDNVAPTPGDTTDTAPIPTDGTGTAPIPSESGTAPIPGEDGGAAPLPNESGTAPIPTENWQPPIPGQP
jgi:hypothetical protein